MLNQESSLNNRSDFAAVRCILSEGNLANSDVDLWRQVRDSKETLGVACNMNFGTSGDGGPCNASEVGMNNGTTRRE